MGNETYVCKSCGLHYKSMALAEECFAWCSKHNSCRLEIARHSIEAEKNR